MNFVVVTCKIISVDFTSAYFSSQYFTPPCFLMVCSSVFSIFQHVECKSFCYKCIVLKMKSTCFMTCLQLIHVHYFLGHPHQFCYMVQIVKDLEGGLPTSFTPQFLLLAKWLQPLCTNMFSFAPGSCHLSPSQPLYPPPLSSIDSDTAKSHLTSMKASFLEIIKYIDRAKRLPFRQSNNK